jgi:integrase/recombinase XerD
VRLAVIAVRSLHRFACAEGLTADDPARNIRPPKPPRRLPKALSLEQVQAMLAVPGTDNEVGFRDAALLELLYGTGIRISEAVSLDVDEVDRLVRARAGEPAPGLRVLGKGGKERIVPARLVRTGGAGCIPGTRRPVLPQQAAAFALFEYGAGGYWSERK